MTWLYTEFVRLAAKTYGILLLADTTPHAYPVEVSGWDTAGAFFVERSDLHWDAPGIRTVRLRHHLDRGDLVFLRLITVEGVGHNCPIPHQAERVEPADQAGWSTVRLVRPKPYTESPIPRVSRSSIL